MKNRIVHDYAKLGDGPLGEDGLDKADKLEANAAKVTTTVTSVLLKAKAQQLINDVASCENGTAEDTLRKKGTRKELLLMIDTLANDVENTANVPPGDPTLVVTFGFKLASTSHAASAPNGTAITDVTNPGPTRLQLQLQHDSNAWCYIIEDTELPNGPTRNVTVTDPDNAVLTGCKSGSMHSLRACTMSARNQASEWSEPVQHMST